MLNWFILNTSSSRAGPWFNYKSPTVTLPLPTGRSLFLVIGKLVWGLLGLGFWLSDRSIYFFPSHQMDWQGQKRAEILMQIMLVVSAVAAFGVGYTIGSFRTMMLAYAGGVVLTTLITVPNWPFFNRHPLKWLDPSEAERHPKPQVNSAAASSKKKAAKHK
ncbi:unnamed protein product [Musa hybrid cultivar]